MQHKSTVPCLEFHNQFEGTREDILLQKKLIEENWKKQQREGQSKFRVDKKLQKKGK